MASSWAEYEATQHRGSGGGDGGDGTSLHTSGNSSKLKLKKRSSSAGSKRTSERAPTGIDALYVDAPRGIDTRLKFQWIRPHPSSAILAAAASSSTSASASKSGDAVGGGANGISPHIVEAARLVEHYRHAKADTDGESKNALDECSKKRRLPMPRVDLGCCNATVELTSLFDPPLLSEWGTPVVAINASYDDNNDDQGNYSDSDSEESYARHGDGKSKQASASEVESALGKLVQCAATKGMTRLDDSIKQVFCNLSAVTTSDRLLQLLPSRMLLQIVQNAGDGISYLPLGVTSLTLLANIAPTESMGRHILSVLVPVLLSSSSDAALEMKGNIDTSLELLAKVLVHKCDLGKLSKNILLQLAEEGVVGASNTGEPSELMDQFLLAIGRAYHE